MNKFKYISRYSETDELDNHGRWARICYYNKLPICWISKRKHDDVIYFQVNDYFPSINSDTPNYCGIELVKDFEEIKIDLENRFTKFLFIINN